MPTARSISAIRISSKVPTRALMSKRYAQNLRKTIGERATPSSEIRNGDPAKAEGDNTTHFSVVDRFGNAVSNTYTLNLSYGVGLIADGTGVLLNNELDDFAAKPGAPNAFGLVGASANAPAPRKRPLSSMTPTIVLKDGKPYLVTGSPGGSRIISTVLQVIVNVLDHEMNARGRGRGAAHPSSMAAGPGFGRARLSRGDAEGAGGARPRASWCA